MNRFDNTETADTTMADAFAKAGFDGSTGDDREPGHTASPTAAVCELARLHGATPGPDEPDNRPVWGEDEAIAGIEQAFHTLIETVAPDGTQLADERECLLWGFVNTFHAQVQRLDRAVDRLAPEMRELGRAQDGTEVKSWELERITERATTSATDATPSRSSATSQPTPTAPRPANSGGPVTARTPARPASSPPRPSTHATSSAPARTARPAPTSPTEPSSPSPAARRPRTSAPSGAPSIASRPATPT